jgi:hypothetical protein
VTGPKLKQSIKLPAPVAAVYAVAELERCYPGRKFIKKGKTCIHDVNPH